MNDTWNRNDLTIGEISGILDIPAKMLRYWDEIDLLKPHSINEMNGYRYYSSSQFYLLNFIKYLRKLDVPYGTIKARLHDTDFGYLASLLKEQVEVTDSKIRELNSIKETFLHHIGDMEDATRIKDLDTVIVQPYPERKVIRQVSAINSRLEFEVSIGKLEKQIHGNPTLLISQVGLILCMKDLLAGRYETFCGSFVPYGTYTAVDRAVSILPEGEYATIRFWGSIRTSEKYYGMLIEFVKDNHYSILGDMTRRCLAPGMIQENHAHLAEIAIPVQKETFK